MQHWTFPLQRSNRGDRQPAFWAHVDSLWIVTSSSCLRRIIIWRDYYYLDHYYSFFLFCFVFFPRMLIKEPCWRDYSRLWKLWRSPNVIIRSTSRLMFAEVTGVGSAFHIWMCAWAWGFIILCSAPKLSRSECVAVKVRYAGSRVSYVRSLWCSDVCAGMCSDYFCSYDRSDDNHSWRVTWHVPSSSVQHVFFINAVITFALQPVQSAHAHTCGAFPLVYINSALPRIGRFLLGC